MFRSIWDRMKVEFSPWTEAIIVVEYAGLRIARVNSKHYETGDFLDKDFREWVNRNKSLLLPKKTELQSILRILEGKRIHCIGWVDCEMRNYNSPDEYIRPLKDFFEIGQTVV